MVQIVAWKSEADGKIFESKSKYQAHLRRLARHRLAQRKLQIAAAEKDAVWAELYEREQSINDWFQMVIDLQHLFWAEAAAGNCYDWDRVGKQLGRGKNAGVMPQPRVLEITQDLRWSDSISNTHSCPHNGVENWGGRVVGAPHGYPGWAGRIEWLVAWPREFDGIYLGGDLFSRGSFRSGRQRAHTGTGGGGGMTYSNKHKCDVQKFGYDFRIYAADWPGMDRFREKQRMWNILNNKAAA